MYLWNIHYLPFMQIIDIWKIFLVVVVLLPFPPPDFEINVSFVAPGQFWTFDYCFWNFQMGITPAGGWRCNINGWLVVVIDAINCTVVFGHNFVLLVRRSVGWFGCLFGCVWLTGTTAAGAAMDLLAWSPLNGRSFGTLKTNIRMEASIIGMINDILDATIRQ